MSFAISQNLGVYLTEKRSQRKILSLSKGLSLDSYTMSTISIEKGTSSTIAVSSIFIAMFNIPTLIHIHNDISYVEVTVSDIFSISFSGSIEIIYPSTSTMTGNLAVSYIAS